MGHPEGNLCGHFHTHMKNFVQDSRPEAGLNEAQSDECGSTEPKTALRAY
jgi:hypothetical protein